MADFNKVILLGRLTADPELRYTSGGTGVCNFTLAVNRHYKDSSGERQEETLFQRITVWGQQGVNCAEYLAKGRQALVEGYLKTSQYEDSEGNTRYSTDVVANNVQFLGGSSGSNEDDFEDTSKKKKSTRKKKSKAEEDDIPF